MKTQCREEINLGPGGPGRRCLKRQGHRGRHEREVAGTGGYLKIVWGAKTKEIAREPGFE